MGYTSKYKGAEIDALLDKVEALPEGGGEGGSAPMMIEVTWEELVALRDAANLTAGQMYRITDYETMTSKEGSQAAGHPFDIIVTALDNKTLDEKASAIWSARDTEGYFANSNLPAWDVRYCLDNDKSRFDWAVAPGKAITVDLSTMGGQIITGTLNGTYVYQGTTYAKWDVFFQGMEAYALTPSENVTIGEVPIIYMPSQDMGVKAGTVTYIEEDNISGKGVIYRLADESNNNLPYDFKNIMFARKLNSNGEYDAESGVATFVYTFNFMSDGSACDASVVSGIPVRENYMGEVSSLANNVFLLKATGFCFLNTFGDDCHDNTFGSDTYMNTFGFKFYNNVCGNSFTVNTCKGNCHNNVFGDNCHESNFGYMFYNNVIEGSFNSCSFGGNNFDHTFARSCHGIEMSADCQGVSFGEKGEIINAHNIKIKNVRGIKITRPKGTESEPIFFYTIGPINAFGGTDGPEIELNFENKSCEKYITTKKDGTIVEYTIDDILNS